MPNSRRSSTTLSYSERANYTRNAHISNAEPGSAWIKGTTAIHVTRVYVSWYVRVVDTHSIFKCYCEYLS